MQKVRGFIFFEGRSIEDIEKSFTGFKLDLLSYSFFEDFKKDEKFIEDKGFFIYGKVDDRYSSADIINLLRKQTGLGEAKFERIPTPTRAHYKPVSVECDVSIETEDSFMKEIKENAKVEGNYIGIRIKPPVNIVEIQDITSKIGAWQGIKSVYVRNVEIDKEQLNKPKVCIDLITNLSFQEARKRIEDAYKKFKIEKISTARIFL